MRCQAKYAPKHQGIKIKEPIFETKEEAWQWIEDEGRKCDCKVDLDNDGRCHSCEAEWYVEEIV